MILSAKSRARSVSAMLSMHIPIFRFGSGAAKGSLLKSTTKRVIAFSCGQGTRFRLAQAPVIVLAYSGHQPATRLDARCRRTTSAHGVGPAGRILCAIGAASIIPQIQPMDPTPAADFEVFECRRVPNYIPDRIGSRWQGLLWTQTPVSLAGRARIERFRSAPMVCSRPSGDG